MTSERKQLPCPNCGAEAVNGETTTTVVEDDSFSFQGETAERELPAKVCPECGEVIAL